MNARNILFALLFAFIASCKDRPQQKGPIIGMDEEADTFHLNRALPSTIDSLDTAARRSVLEHDSVYRNRKGQGSNPGSITDLNNMVNLKLFINELKQLVTVNNKKEIARRIKYPLNGSIKNSSEFYVNYDKLFTPAVRSALAATDVNKLPRTQRSVMIANGKILIARQANEFKIIRINN